MKYDGQEIPSLIYELRSRPVIDPKVLSAHLLVVPLGRDVLWGLRTSLGVAEREVVRVRLVAVAATADVLAATRTLALRILRSRSEVFRIARSGQLIILRDPFKPQNTRLPQVLEVRERGYSTRDVAEVPEGDIPRPSNKLEAVLQDDGLDVVLERPVHPRLVIPGNLSCSVVVSSIPSPTAGEAGQ